LRAQGGELALFHQLRELGPDEGGEFVTRCHRQPSLSRWWFQWCASSLHCLKGVRFFLRIPMPNVCQHVIIVQGVTPTPYVGKQVAVSIQPLSRIVQLLLAGIFKVGQQFGIAAQHIAAATPGTTVSVTVPRAA